MTRFLAMAFALLLASTSFAQPRDIKRAKFVKFDSDKKLVTLSVDGKDVAFAVDESTRVFGAEKKEFADRYSTLKAGAAVMYLVGKRNGKEVLDGIRPVDAPEIAKVDTSKLKPLDELGTEKYQGHQGGFYPGGKNARPADHEKAGLALAKAIKPLDAAGKEDAKSGRVVMLSVGMSNTSQASAGFAALLRDSDKVHPQFLFINGAQGGMTAEAIRDPDDKGRGTKYWDEVDRRLKQAKSSREQVQVIWIKQADAGPSQGFPKYAQKLEGELADIVRLFPKRFPNAKLVYLSSRTYGGYAKTRFNPEPYAFESAFSVKWLIEKQLAGDKGLNHDPKNGDVKAPWLSWGPYLWANGTKKSKDGFAYEESDFANDGTHQSPAGQKKVGQRMFDFFSADSTSKGWFVK